MPTKITPTATKRRSQAEARLRKRQEHQKTKPDKAKSTLDAQRLLHELQVHQVELEMQNAELYEARDRLETLLEKYTDIYDFSPVGYFTLTATGTIQQTNLTGADLIATERSRLVGQPFGSFVTAESRSTFSAFLKQVFTTEIRHEADFQLLVKGQPGRVVKIRAQRSPNKKECSAVLVDITERKHAEDQMRVSEVRYRRLFEAAHDGVLLLDPNTRKITDANPFMTMLLGYPKDQLAGRELFEIGLLKDASASKEMFRRLKSQHQVRYDNLPLKSQEGRHQEVEVVANLYRENGHDVIQCNIRDITKRKQMEDVLRRSEALFSALIGQAPVGVYVVDAGFHLQQVNGKALPVFRNVHPLIGRDFSEIVHILWPKRVADQVEWQFRQTLTTGEPFQSPEFTGRRQDIGVQEIYEWQLQRVTLTGGEHAVVCFFNDITARKHAEWAQRRLEVMAATNKKLELEIVRRQAVETSLKKSEQHQMQLLNDAQQLQKQLRGLSHRILHAQEDERKRISRELHDVIAQTLVGINVHLSSLTRGDKDGGKSFQQKIALTQRMVEESVEKVHRFARELRPAMLDDLGLLPALQSFMKTYTEDTGVRVTLHAFAEIEKTSIARRSVLFRIVQEALTNVARHSKASQVKVSIERIKSTIKMEITDDGQGFEVEGVMSEKKPKRLGILGMKERIEMVGGSFYVESAPGQHTTVRVKLPTERARPVSGGNSQPVKT